MHRYHFRISVSSNVRFSYLLLGDISTPHYSPPNSFPPPNPYALHSTLPPPLQFGVIHKNTNLKSQWWWLPSDPIATLNPHDFKFCLSALIFPKVAERNPRLPWRSLSAHNVYHDNASALLNAPYAPLHYWDVSEINASLFILERGGVIWILSNSHDPPPLIHATIGQY